MPEATGVMGLVLAGGAGRRMGGADKAFLPLAGRPLLSHVAERLAPQTDAMAISANGDPARFDGFGLAVLADAAPDRGPLSGILAGLDHAAGHGMRSVLSVAVDTPFLPGDLARRFLAAPGPVAMAESDGRLHGTIALWPVDTREGLRAALEAGTRRVRDWAEMVGVTPVHFEASAGDPFFNINTAEDLALAEDRLARG